MPRKRYIQLDANRICFHDLRYEGARSPQVGPELVDVTARTDGPFLGKIYDAQSDTFSDPPPPPEDEAEE